MLLIAVMKTDEKNYKSDVFNELSSLIDFWWTILKTQTGAVKLDNIFEAFLV